MRLPRTTRRSFLTLWVVYDHPRDLPEWYVVRGQEVGSDGSVTPHAEPEMLVTDLDTIRNEMRRRGLSRLPPNAADDPKIVEVWL